MSTTVTPAFGSSGVFFPEIEHHPLMIEDAWIEHRAQSLTPDGVTELVTTERDRREFLTGAHLMGILDFDPDGDHYPKPQQLLVVDMLAAGHAVNGVLMPRRSTKTSTILAVFLGRCACRPRRNSAFTLATTGLKAREKFRTEVLDVIESAYPDPKNRPVTISRQAGAEAVRFPNRSVFAVHAPIGDNFRGSAYHEVLVDESGRADVEMTDDLLAAIPPTFDTTNGQLVVAGTADDIRTGNLLWTVIFEKADELGAGIIRYHAPDSTTDEELADWEPSPQHPHANVKNLILKHHPGIGNLTPLDAVRRNFALQPRHKFILEYLGIFGDTASTATIIDPAKWERTTLGGAMPDRPTDFTLAIAVHPDGLWASAAVAWRHTLEPDDLVSIAEHLDGDKPVETRTAIGLLWWQPGTKGFANKVLTLARKFRVPVIYDQASQAAAVEIEQLQRASPRPALTPAATVDVRQGTTKLLKLLDEGDLAHWRSEHLDAAAAKAIKRQIGTYGGYGLGRPKDDPNADITPLEAACLAIQKLGEPTPKLDPRKIIEFA